MSKAAEVTVLIITGLMVFACERIKTRKEKYPSGKLKARYEVTVSRAGEFKNGIYEEFYESGKIKSIINYVDNKEHGLYRSYFDTGKPEAEIFYLKGNMHGDYKEWYDNGKKKRFARYREGLLNGEVKTWNAEGELVSKAIFKKGICRKGDCRKVKQDPDTKIN